MRLRISPRPSKAVVVRPGDVLVITFHERVTAHLADIIRLRAKAIGVDVLVLDHVDQIGLMTGDRA